MCKIFWNVRGLHGLLGFARNNSFVGVPKDSNCAICEMTDRMRARCQKRLERRRDCIACPTTLGEVLPPDHKVLCEDK